MSHDPRYADDQRSKSRAEKIAEALEADLLARQSAAVGLPSPSQASLAHPHITPEAEPILGRLFFDLAYRAGILEALRTVAFELALASDDRQALHALGVAGMYRPRGGGEPERANLHSHLWNSAQLRSCEWRWADGTAIPRIEFPEGLGRWAVELAADRLTSPTPDGLSLIQPANRRRQARRKNDPKPSDTRREEEV
jgi:hypothetical protein